MQGKILSCVKDLKFHAMIICHFVLTIHIKIFEKKMIMSQTFE